jgi:hypothetical protein
MKVLFTPIAESKLKAVNAAERKAVQGVAQRLRGANTVLGQRLLGLENSYSVSASPKGPVLLYEVSSDGVATVKGIITARQRELGKLTTSSRGT